MSTSSLRVAVTGASGFIGGHVLKELSGLSVSIVAVTRRKEGHVDWPDGLTVVEMDISEPPQGCYERLGCPDVLIHLAWDGLPNYWSLHHFETELPRQYAFLREMIRSGLPSLLVTGTCFEYGLTSGSLSEDLQTCPHTPYGHAKDALRRQLEFLQREQNYHLTWARLFYMFGEGQSGNSLYSLLREAVRNGDQCFRMSGGEQLRDYLPVSEVARLIVLLALMSKAAGVVNVCSGRATSVRRLVEQWIEENGWNIRPQLGYYPYPEYEPMAFWGSRDRLNALLTSTGSEA